MPDRAAATILALHTEVKKPIGTGLSAGLALIARPTSPRCCPDGQLQLGPPRPCRSAVPLGAQARPPSLHRRPPTGPEPWLAPAPCRPASFLQAPSSPTRSGAFGPQPPRRPPGAAPRTAQARPHLCSSPSRCRRLTPPRPRSVLLSAEAIAPQAVPVLTHPPPGARTSRRSVQSSTATLIGDGAAGRGAMPVVPARGGAGHPDGGTGPGAAAQHGRPLLVALLLLVGLLLLLLHDLRVPAGSAAGLAAGPAPPRGESRERVGGSRRGRPGAHLCLRAAAESPSSRRLPFPESLCFFRFFCRASSR